MVLIFFVVFFKTADDLYSKIISQGTHDNFILKFYKISHSLLFMLYSAKFSVFIKM